MKLIIDSPVKRPDGKWWCHFGASSVEDLHSAASKIGLKRQWFQDKKNRPHYDIYSPRLIENAMKLGAIRVTSKQFVQYMKIWFESNN